MTRNRIWIHHRRGHQTTDPGKYSHALSLTLLHSGRVRSSYIHKTSSKDHVHLQLLVPKKHCLLWQYNLEAKKTHVAIKSYFWRFLGLHNVASFQDSTCWHLESVPFVTEIRCHQTYCCQHVNTEVDNDCCGMQWNVKIWPVDACKSV